MSTPTAAHTFDFTRVYLSTRDNGAPGAGVWSGSTLIFDGSLDGTEAVTFSAGALDSLDSRGIVCNSKTNKLTFLGDGLPTAPILINITGEGNVGSSDFWDTTQGAFKHGSDYYMPYYSSTGGLKIAKSSDDGATWTKKDQGNGPSAITVAIDATIQRVNNKICVCTWLDNGETDLAIWEFDMTTDLWSAVIANVASNMTRFALGYRWTNALFKFVNGDYLVVYMTNTFVAPFGVYPVARLWTQASNTWGAELVLPGRDFAQAVMDPDLNIVHLMTYDTTSRSSTVHYSEFNHNTSTLTTDITTFVNGASSDGVGHSSIQNGKLFVPLDAAADFANAVYVAAIPVVSFSKELLPVPATAQGVIASIALNGTGSGYVNGDTFTVNGGIVPLATGIVNHVFNNAIASTSGSAAGSGYVAGDTFTVNGGGTLSHGRVLTVGALGIVTSYALLTLGAGYAVAAGVATTATSGVGSGLALDILSLINGVSDVTITDGGQGYSVNASVATTATSGVGVGLTINILSIATKIPTCAYMMYPNGYSLTIPTPALTCPIGGGTATIGVPYSAFLVATGGTPPYTYSIASGALPPGLSLNATTGEISGTPTTAGAYAYIARVTDANGLTADTSPGCTINVSAGTLTATCPPSAHFSVGTPYSAQVGFSGGVPPYTFAIIAGSLPPGVTLNTSTGLISGTPTLGGDYSYTVQITDSLGNTANTASCPLDLCPGVKSELTPPPPVAMAGDICDQSVRSSPKSLL